MTVAPATSSPQIIPFLAEMASKIRRRVASAKAFEIFSIRARSMYGSSVTETAADKHK